jgi:iron complex transport system substrate-binding protein
VLRRSLALVALAAAFVSLSSAAGAATKAVPFPVTVSAANGKVTVTRQPRRIVSISPTATEVLFAVGAGSQVIAVDDQSDHPRNAPRTKLSGFTPNVEAIASYRPDLVVASFDPKGLVNALQKLRIKVVLQPAAATLEQAYTQIHQLGALTGHASQAGALVARMKKRIATAVTAVKDRAAGLSVYHELGPDFYSATSSTFAGRVYALFGLKNIADAADSTKSGYPQLSAEYIVSQSPDLIVLADSVCCAQTPATVAARPGWSRIAAVRTGSIVRINDSLASRWGPRIVDFVRGIAAAIRHTGS